jgi:uncharacterized protein YjbJ (UPF0337 family)
MLPGCIFSAYFSCSENGVFRVLLLCRDAGRVVVKEQTRGGYMNWDQMKGKWTQMKGSAKTRWGKLTDDDLDVIGGQKDQLIGRIQERYGIQKEEAQNQVDEWGRNYDQDTELERERLNRKAS